MNAETYNLEEERLREEIIRRGAKRVLLQLPEGLKAEGPRLAAMVEGAGALAIVTADPCYGACDLAISDAEALDVDLLVHYGHSRIMKEGGRIPTIYLEARAKISVEAAVRKAIPLLDNYGSLGLVTTVQHVHTLDEVRGVLHKAGKRVAVGEPRGLAKYPGQVIGCDYSAAQSILDEAEAFLFIGGGKFHALGVALATGKPTVVADPYEQRAHSLDAEVRRILKQRWANIHEAKGAENFGVIIGLKTGQKRMRDALRIKEKLEKGGRRATLLALREVVPEALMEFPKMEAFVNTACPRIGLDDASRFSKPILTYKETLVMLGEMRWEELYTKGWFRR
jgi:2-(3-amino-3-carboxypropyl)histidine synthase